MKFSKYVFLISGIYGVLALVPLYFLENNPQFVKPPAVTHPEFYYGFIGVGFAWQVAFFIISRDPVRYRIMMIPSILEKLSFCIALFYLIAIHRTNPSMMLAGIADLLMAILFGVSYFRTIKAAKNTVGT